MDNRKKILVTAFALFSLFFGAGNLILPPKLGFQSGELWLLVALGFCLSAVFIPILGILAHAKLQGTIFDFGKKVSPVFSLVYSFIIYAISISLPSPRTASVTHEMAIQPFFDSPPWVTSIIYFTLVFLFVMNRSRILNIIGKFLTPAIILILLCIIGVAFFNFKFEFLSLAYENPFSKGILEGYQTFDAIGAVVVGGVIIVSIDLQYKEDSYAQKKVLIQKAGWLAGSGLFLIYTGLIITGALFRNGFGALTTRTELLQGISLETLGAIGHLFLSALVSLACFTTAVGIVAGAADFVKSRFQNSQNAYLLTAIIGAILGVVMGQLDVGAIIMIAFPFLMLIYPITIVLIILNALPDKYAPPMVFKAVVITTLILSIPDFLIAIDPLGIRKDTFHWIPLNSYQMGWVLPALVVFGVANIFSIKQSR
ncbi:branched-chain amino acid transport system II carrier protein [Maribacter sp. 2304DJ31-5]|uniref:branched-chain amino acid transport system II carrier protein n=1 Tax=Maribacter sp. 2304DJ31-5 TaxID=3386273 RepID=UPI0039BC8D30